MRMIRISEEREIENFARMAAEKFEENGELYSLSVCNPEAGGYLALRWGSRDDCVLVVKLDELFEPRVYQQMIPEQISREELARRKRED